jgi:hypothetical protein
MPTHNKHNNNRRTAAAAGTSRRRRDSRMRPAEIPSGPENLSGTLVVHYAREGQSWSGTAYNPDCIPEALRRSVTKIEFVPPEGSGEKPPRALALPSAELEVVKTTGALPASSLAAAAAGDNLAQALGRLFVFPNVTAALEMAAQRANNPVKLTASDVATLLQEAGDDRVTVGLCGLHLLRAVQRVAGPVHIAAPVSAILPFLMLGAPEWLLPTLATVAAANKRPMRVTMHVWVEGVPPPRTGTVAPGQLLQAYAAPTGAVGTRKSCTPVRLDGEMWRNIGLCCACDADCCMILALYRVRKVHHRRDAEDIMLPVSLLHKFNREGLATKGAEGRRNLGRLMETVVTWVETRLAPNVLPATTAAAAATADEQAQLLFQLCEEAQILEPLDAVFAALVRALAEANNPAREEANRRAATSAYLSEFLDDKKQYDKAGIMRALGGIMDSVDGRAKARTLDGIHSSFAQTADCILKDKWGSKVPKSQGAAKIAEEKCRRPVGENCGANFPPVPRLEEFPGLTK